MRARTSWHGLRRPAALPERDGDTVDGLLQVRATLARNHRLISACLASRHSELIQAIEFEKVLDHFVNAKLQRRRFGSKAAVRRTANHFRSTLINGHYWTGLVGPFDARSGRDPITVNNPLDRARLVRGCGIVTPVFTCDCRVH